MFSNSAVRFGSPKLLRISPEMVTGLLKNGTPEELQPLVEYKTAADEVVREMAGIYTQIPDSVSIEYMQIKGKSSNGYNQVRDAVNLSIEDKGTTHQFVIQRETDNKATGQWIEQKRHYYLTPTDTIKDFWKRVFTTALTICQLIGVTDKPQNNYYGPVVITPASEEDRQLIKRVRA